MSDFTRSAVMWIRGTRLSAWLRAVVPPVWRFLDRTTLRATRVVQGLTVLGATAALGVLFAIGTQYTVHNTRDASYWMTYYSVKPTREEFPPGIKPRFRTHAVRHKDIDAWWPDQLWCVDREGPEAGRLRHVDTVRGTTPRRVGPAYIGFDSPISGGDTDYAQTDGLWTWPGVLPDTRGDCFVVAEVRFCPSFGVCKSIKIESESVTIGGRDSREFSGPPSSWREESGS